jgi:hypothetical protein
VSCLLVVASGVKAIDRCPMEGCPATVQQHNPYLQGVDNLLMDIVEHFCRCELERQALEIRSPSRTAAHRHAPRVELQTTDLTGDL